MLSITHAQKIKKNTAFVTISRKEYEELVALKKIIPTLTQQAIWEEHILRLSQEARKLKKIKKLSLLQSLRTLR